MRTPEKILERNDGFAGRRGDSHHRMAPRPVAGMNFNGFFDSWGGREDEFELYGADVQSERPRARNGAENAGIQGDPDDRVVLDVDRRWNRKNLGCSLCTLWMSPPVSAARAGARSGQEWSEDIR
ncbi:hypothetical protein [Polyangium aurulentum]|uniref:hypothetical protein n=1 Tax=Polyangium aurulentum TaxID=2567896 RepID=UPI0010ADBC10|nr:hypothetical protein [Polyangium aurulentum]UQA59540.1 hypothetical protein E8A73_003230 [Polyangium aurulentum]